MPPDHGRRETSPYERLGKGEIRLLRIEPLQDGSVGGVLEPFGLYHPRRPQYRALSYVWGNDMSSMSVLPFSVNSESAVSHILPIPRSLREFMEVHIKLPGKNEEMKEDWWWIDSVCINQTDSREKSSQVQLMGEIYSNAAETIAWIGSRSSDSRRAFDFLDKLNRKRWEVEESREPGSSARQREENLWNVLQTFNDVRFRPDWNALENLLSRPWWTRVWTVQEFILSPHITFRCGSDELSRSDFLSALYSLWVTRYSGRQSAPEDRASFNKAAFDPAWNRRRLFQWFREREKMQGAISLSLPAMLAYLSDHDATNERDRLYSFLGLTTDRGLILQADYTLTVEQVYFELTVAFIEEYQSLDVICFAQVFNHHQDPNLPHSMPSWVPDWRAKGIRPEVVTLMVSQSGQRHIGNFRPLRSLNYSAIYAAAAGEPPRCDFDVPREIACKGLFIDTIDGLSSSKSKLLTTHSHSMTQSTSKVNGSVDVTTSSDANNVVMKKRLDELIVSLCRCLVLDRRDRYLCHSARVVDIVREYKMLCSMATKSHISTDEAFGDWLNSNGSLLVQGRELVALSGDAAEASENYDADVQDRSNWESFLSRFYDTCVTMARRLIVTDRGLLGMAPVSANKGDIICVLYGCSVPVVLRKRASADAYDFIGECYLDGFMNGEVLTEAQNLDGHVSERNFRIV